MLQKCATRPLSVHTTTLSKAYFELTPVNDFCLHCCSYILAAVHADCGLQMSNVRTSQEALKVALGGVDRAKTKSEVERWVITANELKEKTEHLVLVLQVCLCCTVTLSKQ